MHQDRKRFGRARWSLKTADWDAFFVKVDEKLQEWPDNQVTIGEDNRRFVKAVLAGAKHAVPRGNLKGKIWWTDACATAVEERRQAFESYERDPSPESLMVLAEVRANTDVVITAAKRKCWRDLASTVQADRKGWKLLAAIEGKRSARATIVADCRKSNQDIADDVVKGYVARKRNKVKAQDLK